MLHAVWPLERLSPLDPVRVISKNGYICRQTQMCTLPGGGSRGRSGLGNNEIGVLPGCQRRRIRRGRAPAARQPCSGRNQSLRNISPRCWTESAGYSKAAVGDSRRDLSGSWAKLGLCVPDGSPDALWTTVEPSPVQRVGTGTSAKSQGVSC